MISIVCVITIISTAIKLNSIQGEFNLSEQITVWLYVYCIPIKLSTKVHPFDVLNFHATGNAFLLYGGFVSVRFHKSNLFKHYHKEFVLLLYCQCLLSVSCGKLFIM